MGALRFLLSPKVLKAVGTGLAIFGPELMADRTTPQQIAFERYTKYMSNVQKANRIGVNTFTRTTSRPDVWTKLFGRAL